MGRNIDLTVKQQLVWDTIKQYVKENNKPCSKAIIREKLEFNENQLSAFTKALVVKGYIRSGLSGHKRIYVMLRNN